MIPSSEQIYNLFESFHSISLKAAREADKLGLKASRSFNKRKKSYGNTLGAEHQILLEKIKIAHYEFKLSGSKDLKLKILVKIYG